MEAMTGTLWQYRKGEQNDPVAIKVDKNLCISHTAGDRHDRAVCLQQHKSKQF